MAQSSTYNELASYSQGDEVSFGLNPVNGYYTFIAKEDVAGVAPVSEWRFADSFWRACKWLKNQFENNDEIYHYQGD